MVLGTYFGDHQWHTKLLPCKRELGNAKDPYVVTVCRVNSIVADHIPKKTFLCAVFIKKGSTIQCIVSAIYHHLLTYLDFLLWHYKIVRRTVLFFEGFLVTTIDFLVGLLN